MRRRILLPAALLLCWMVPVHLPAQSPPDQPQRIEEEELPGPEGSEMEEARGGAAAGRQGADPELIALERLAELRYAEGELPAAADLYLELAERHPEPQDRARATVTAAWLQHLAGRPSQALENLTRALVLAPDYAFRFDLYDQGFAELHRDAVRRAAAERRRAANAKIRSALEETEGGRPGAARTLLSEALGTWPDHPVALYNLALLDLDGGRAEAAMAGFERILALARKEGTEVDPALRVQALNNLGILFYDKGFYEDAARLLEEAVSRDPDRATAWNNLGLARRRMGLTGAAGDAFRRAHELAPEDGAVANNLALAYIDSGKWAQAVALLSEALRREGDNGALWLNLGIARRGLGDLAGAADAFAEALALDGSNSEGIGARAGAYLALVSYERGDYPGAMEAARQTLQWRPDDADSWTYLGLAQDAAGDPEAALESLGKALDLEPSRAEVANNLGSVYVTLGNYRAAAEAFERALSLRPDLAAAASNLEQVRRKLAQLNAEGGAEAPGREPAGDRAEGVGLGVAEVDYSELGLRGLLVEEVAAGSPAARAGLRKGDLILRVDGRQVGSRRELFADFRRRSRGETPVLDLLREGRPLKVRLRLD